MSNTLEDEIAYMKSLAEEGRHRPVLNGGSLFWAGICFGAASLVHYAFETDMITPANGWYYVVNWVGAGILYGFLAWWSISASYRRYGPAGEMNRTIGSMWSGVGFSIFAISMCLIVAGLSGERLQGAMTLLAPAVLVLYALGWWVVSDVSRLGWLRMVSLGAFAGALGTAFLSGQPEQFLAYAACLILFATAPGLILMRSERD